MFFNAMFISLHKEHFARVSPGMRGFWHYLLPHGRCYSLQHLFSQLVFGVICWGSWRGGKIHFPAQILSKSHFSAWFLAKSQSQQWNFREIPVHRKSKLKHCQYECAVNILIFRLGFFWSVLLLSVTNAITIKLWVRIGRLNMFPLRFASWVDDVMWHGNYVIASSGCHHESTIFSGFLDFSHDKEQKEY